MCSRRLNLRKQLKDNKIMMFKGHTQREYAPIAEVNG